MLFTAKIIDPDFLLVDFCWPEERRPEKEKMAGVERYAEL